MTEREVARATVFMKVKEKRLKQTEAAIELGISLRQAQRIYKSYKQHGIIALASQKRGKRSNRKLAEPIRVKVIEIVTTPIYAGFGPTLMAEKLEENHHIKISRESVRKIMTESGVWSAEKEKRPVIHQQRQRRARSGELVQIDGSPHAWFEDRGERCDLLVFIDDATGRTYGKFFESETTAGYMETALEYIQLYGKPLMMYSDRDGIFRVNQGQCKEKGNLTQFGRALKELDIGLIYANSPQAKGRVEKANQTLQDRLIKEMRLCGVSTIEEGNKFLEKYWDKHNNRFAVTPRCLEDAHRKGSKLEELKKSFSRKEERVISKNLEFQYENEIYQVMVKKPSRELIRAKVVVIKGLDNSLTFEYKGKTLSVRKYGEVEFSGREVSSKELEHYKADRGEHKVPNNHVWKQEGRARKRMKDYLAA